MCLSPWWFFMTINTPSPEDFWLILYTESLFSLEIGTETMFQTDLYQSSLSLTSSCTTTELSKLLTSCLTAVKNHVIRYCEKVYERSGEGLFWSVGGSDRVLDGLGSGGFRATSLSTYDFSTLYATLPHGLVGEKLVGLIGWTFFLGGGGSPCVACGEGRAFFASEDAGRCKLWSCPNVCEALMCLLDNIYVGFGTKL